MYGVGNNAVNMGQGFMNQGMKGYQDQLSQMQNLGPQRFQYDQGTANAVMNQMSGGLTSQANLAGLLSSRNLDSQLGQLMGAAGTTGQFGTQLSSKLAGNAASANALSREALQGQIQNLYTNAAGTAANAGMSAGGKNMASAIGNQQALLGGYRNMANMGFNFGRQGAGLMGAAGTGLQDYNQMYTDNLRHQFMDRQSIPITDMINRINTYGSLGGQQTNSVDNSLWGNIGAGIQGGVQGYNIYKDIFSGDD